MLTGANGKAGSRNETETGNGNQKWKLEMEIGTKNTPITGAMFSHSMLTHYESCALPLLLYCAL